MNILFQNYLKKKKKKKNPFPNKHLNNPLIIRDNLCPNKMLLIDLAQYS